VNDTPELRSFAIRTSAGDLLHLDCDRVKITSRGDLLAIVGGFATDDDTRARCIAALPNGTWLSVTDDDYADPPPTPLHRKSPT
jgi:hypothetical protein